MLKPTPQNIFNLPAVGAFLLIFGTMLLTIKYYGTSVPFYDEWGAEGNWLYQRYQEGDFKFADLFAPHNGHYIFMTRLTAILLFIVNGGWDPELQMIINGFLHALTGAVLVNLVLEHSPNSSKALAVIATTILFAIPFSWLSILIAFQTQFYYMLLFSILALIYLSASKYILGYLFTILSMLSMTSGAFILPAFIATILVDSIRHRSITREQIVHIAISGIMFTVFVLTLVPDSGIETFHAQHLRGFIVTVLAAISWPFRVSYGIGTVLYIPMSLFILWGIFIARAPKIYMALAMFLALQILGMGYFRGGEGMAPANRYWEILVMGICLNGMCLLFLVQHSKKWVAKPLALFWCVVTAIGMTSAAYTSLSDGLPGRKAHSLTAQALISEYVETGNREVFQGYSDFDVSHPNTEELIRLLSTPQLRSILPSSFGVNNTDRLATTKQGFLFSSWLFICAGLIFFVLYLRPYLQLLGRFDKRG